MHTSRKIILVSLLAGLALAMAPGVENVAAAPEQMSREIPEVSGDYAVPGHDNLRVRVFVHPVKAMGKPAPSSTLDCSNTDIDGTAVVHPEAWRIPSGNWTYRVNPAGPSSVASSIGTIVSNSFAAWKAIPDLGFITLVNGGSTSANRAVRDGQNIIAWGRTSGSALGVTYIWYDQITNQVSEVDTIMNNKFSWGWSGAENCAYTNVYDAESTLTHEIGHWFGLDDEYDASLYGNHTMYGYGSKGDPAQRTLTTGDRAGIEAIY